MKHMDELICKNCGYSVFVPLNRKDSSEFRCVKCKETIEYKGNKKHFLTPTDNELFKMITNLGYDLGEAALQSNTVKAGAAALVTSCLGASIPAIGAVSFLVGRIPGILKLVTEKKLFAEKTVQQQFTDLFNKMLNKHLNAGKKKMGTPDHQFKLYYCRCADLSALILQNIQEKGLSEDFFDKDTINYVYHNIYTDNPTQEEFDNIISVSKEIIKEYKAAIFSDPKLKEEYDEIQRKKDVTEKLEYLTAKTDSIAAAVNNTADRVDECLSILKQFSIKADFSIESDNRDYLSAYFSELFFEEENSPLTLGSIYIDSSVENSNLKASELINDWFENDKEHTTLLVYGSAGVGKSSLCSKMIADAAERERESDEPTLFSIPAEKIHIKALRNCGKDLKEFEYDTVDKLVEKIFASGGRKIDYSGDLFVLDGLDELAVLCPEFDIQHLFKKLSGLSTRKYKLLITSRRSDKYSLGCNDEHIRVETLEWHEDDMASWCDEYSKLKNDQETQEWCSSFKKFYGELEDSDKRKEVFSVPVILYIAAYNKVDFSANSSLCQIYKEAFSCLLEREHISKTDGSEAFEGNSTDKELRTKYWQYTKELAFQMAISNELLLSLTGDGDDSSIKKAQRRTLEIVKPDGKNSDENSTFDIDNTNYLAVFQFARSDENGQCIEFVHKTVYEYFAAVKLFEDYFRDITAECTYDDVWHRIVQAFRYTDIDPDIMKYLAEMMLESKSVDIEKFYGYVFGGLTTYEIYHQFMVCKGISDYKDHTDEYMFVKICFSNLIRLLTLIGYKNESYKEFIYNKSTLKKAFDTCFRDLLIVDHKIIYDFSNWCFKGIDMRGINLYSCSFANADMSYADLSGAFIDNEAVMLESDGKDFCKVNMESAILRGAEIRYSLFDKAKMKGADMRGASLLGVSFKGADLRNVDLNASEIDRVIFDNSDLRGAKLNGAIIYGSSFENADLRGADLRGMRFKDLKSNQYFRGARYNTKGSQITRFPKGFDPEQQGMILDNSPYSD